MKRINSFSGLLIVSGLVVVCTVVAVDGQSAAVDRAALQDNAVEKIATVVQTNQ
jgi:hypothetical protein